MKILIENQQLSLVDNSVAIHDTLPIGMYTLCYNSISEKFYLQKQEFDKFKIPSKLYGNVYDVIERIKRAYYRRNKKMGIILHGEKGTGKSLISKNVINDINIPVIMIKDLFDDHTALENFLNELKTPVIVFIDEFEKIYHRAELQTEILSIMDGTGQSDIFFVLTSNGNDNVSYYLKNRPSRMYYNIEFKGLTEDTIKAVMDDKFVDDASQTLILRACTIIGTINFDMLICMIDEIRSENITDINELFYYMNIEPSIETYNVIVRSKLYPNAGVRYHSYRNNPLLKGFNESDYLEDLVTFKEYLDKNGDNIYANMSIQPHEFQNLVIETDKITFESNEYSYVFEKHSYNGLVF